MKENDDAITFDTDLIDEMFDEIDAEIGDSCTERELSVW